MKNKLFAGMSEETVRNFIQDAGVIDVPAGTEVLLEGANVAGVQLYLIISGSVRIVRSLSGYENEVLAELGPTEFFGEMSIPEGESRSAKVLTVDSCKLMILERDTFDRLCSLEPTKVVENIIRTLGARLRKMNDTVINSRVRQLKLAAIGSVVQEIVHDIKSPLNAVVGVADLLDEGVATAESSGMLRRAVQSVLGLVEDILAFASDKPRRPYVEFSVKKLIANVEDFGLVPIERKKALTVRRSYEYLGEMFGDPVAVERALLNLIKNAHEAMSAGGTLFVSTLLVGENVRFVVRDTGSGLPDAVKEKLFTPFITFGKVGGSGLGLSMVKRVVDAHLGRVDVTSGGNGTQFVLDLPRFKSGRHAP